MLVPQLAVDPEIMDLSRIEKYLFVVKIKVSFFNTECHFSCFSI
jgi:hypothetical protein